MDMVKERYYNYSADKLFGSILSKQNDFQIPLDSLYKWESSIKTVYPNVVFSVTEDDVCDALESFPEVFTRKENTIVLSEHNGSDKLVNLYFSSTIDNELIELILKNYKIDNKKGRKKKD